MDLHELEHLREVLTESLTHTALMMPILFAVFVIVEAVAHRAGSSKLTRAFAQPFLGPMAASIFGLIPQCGFSVAATALYLEGMIPIGSLISAYISTSDEALPVMLADKSSLPWVLPLILTKLVWGTVAGICINAAVLVRDKRGSNAGHELPHVQSGGKVASCPGEASGATGIMSHALSRTLRTACMVFVLSTVLNLIGHAAEGRIYTALSYQGLLQPVVAALIGLVPSCATSVALAEGFKAGILSFPSVISGLSANSGLGLLILAKESRNKAEVIPIAALLLFAAIVAGILGSMIFPDGYIIGG